MLLLVLLEVVCKKALFVLLLLVMTLLENLEAQQKEAQAILLPPFLPFPWASLPSP